MDVNTYHIHIALSHKRTYSGTQTSFGNETCHFNEAIHQRTVLPLGNSLWLLSSSDRYAVLTGFAY